MDHGEVSVMMIGMIKMLLLFVECLDSGEQYSKIIKVSICSHDLNCHIVEFQPSRFGLGYI